MYQLSLYHSMYYISFHCILKELHCHISLTFEIEVHVAINTVKQTSRILIYATGI